MQITILGKTIEVPDGDDRPREYKCPKCRDKEYIFYTDENGYEFADPCDCLRKKWTLARFERSGLGELAKRSTFKTYWINTPLQAQIKKAAEEYAEDPKGWFFIGGQTGSGKTHICTAICMRLIKHGRDVRYMRWRQDSEQIREDKFARNDSSKLKAFRTADVLYIDDLFKGDSETPSKQDIKLAFDLISSRYDSQLPTIISSELSIGGVVSYDEAIGGRITEMTKLEHLIYVKQDEAANMRLRKGVHHGN